MPASRPLLGATALATLLVAGCAPTSHLANQGATTTAPGTALVLAGSAFGTPATRDGVVEVVAAWTARPTQVVADEAVLERVVQGAAGGDRRFTSAARAEARNATCKKKGRSIATAVAEHADTIVRVRLDAKTTSRPATDDDRAKLGKSGLAGMLSSVGLGRDDVVYETTLEGSVERTRFPGTTTVARQSVRAVDRRLGRHDEPSTPDARPAVTQALAALPTPAASRWDAVARSLVTGGCPVLGTAVADAFVDDAATKRRIRAAAASVLAEPTARRDAAPAPSETAAAAPDGDPSPAPLGDPPPSAPEPAYSCPTLCSLHMVELCNNDRTLWSQHGSKWETTRCGTRRSDAFLEDCYRMQWLSGTYEQSCVRPCEETAEGRTRLMAMLRRSGCLRAGS